VVSAASDEPMVKLDRMPNADNKLFDFVQQYIRQRQAATPARVVATRPVWKSDET